MRLLLNDKKFLTSLLFFLAALAPGCSAQGEGAEAVEEAGAQSQSEKAATQIAPPLYQVGPWNAASFNVEEPFIDVIHANDSRWTSRNFDANAVMDGGYIGAETGLPVSLPNGETLTSKVYFTAPRNSGLITHWDGDWVLDFQTADGNCSASINLLYFPGDPSNAPGACRIEFTRDAANDVTPYHMAVQVKKLDSPLVSLRMYRAGNEALVNAGRIYNPRFAGAVRGYDIVRMMDLQGAGRSTARSVSELATMQAAQWSNSRWRAPKANGVHIEFPFLGMPLEAVFALGDEADVALWVHAPITLGSPVDIYDPAIFDEKPSIWLDNITAAVSANAAAIIASDEWDRYADHFASALIQSGYPADRTLYVTLSNEVWNFAGLYNYTTRYAGALGDNAREGYGKAMARFKLALDAALARAGRTQDIVYVVEGQAANQATTRQALAGAKAFFEARGESWDAHAADFGVSVASYWGAAGYALTKAGIDPNDADALEAWFLNGAPGVSNIAWNVRQWKAHAAEAEKYGVKLIGAYEGGSHLERPNGFTKENHTAFVWGERGGKINAALNKALAEAFPGTILSNYALAGPTGGQPWFEGPLGAENPYRESWERSGPE